MNKTFIIVGSILLALIIFLFTLITFIKNKKKKNIFRLIDELTTKKNSIISSSLIAELSKSKKLITNKKIEKKVNEWQKKFEKLEKEDLPIITDKIVEAETLAISKDYVGANEEITNIEKNIYLIKAKASALLEEIKDLTESEDRNREAITKLKSTYREIVFNYNKNKNDYGDLTNTISLQFENIDKLFSAFEVSVQEKEYTELGRIVKVLDDMIQNIKVVVEESPTILLMAKMVLPKKMKDVKNQCDKLIREGYNLDYLNIEYNIEETNKKINEILDKLAVLNLQDSIFELKTLVDYYESLYGDFDAEKKGKKDYERGLINITERINKVTSVMKNLYREIDNIKETYDLSDDEVSVIDDINKELISVKDSFKLINDRTLCKTTPYSKLGSECEIVAVSLSKVEEKLEMTLKNLGSLKEDEARARDQLLEIKNIINNSRFKIKDYNLPIIPNEFYVELKEAYEAVKEISKEIEKKPISIKVLNMRVDTARDLALKLYQTACSVTRTAAMVEMAIVYGNRYKPCNEDVEKGINEASKLFKKGDYQESLEKILNSLNIVEPGIQKKLLSMIES